jgi:hypothetical protein
VIKIVVVYAITSNVASVGSCHHNGNKPKLDELQIANPYEEDYQTAHRDSVSEYAS